IDSIKPALVFSSPYLHNDTVTLCAGNYFILSILDSITMHDVCNLDTVSPSTVTVNGVSQNYHFSTFANCHPDYFPHATGWHVFDLSLVERAPCNSDSALYHVKDSIYVVLNPLPGDVISLTGNAFLCPG